MGCCSKRVLRKKIIWSRQEDNILVSYINQHGPGQWRHLPVKAGLKRCGKSCRFRWLNYLRPDIKRGSISPDEEELIMRLHRLLGNRWSLIAGRLPGRTDNEIKNLWNTRLKKRVPKDQDNGEDKVVRPKAVRCIRAINIPYPHHQEAILNKGVEDDAAAESWVDALMGLEQGGSCSKVVNDPNTVLNPQNDQSSEAYGGNNMFDDHMSKEAMDLSALLSSFLNSEHDQWILPPCKQ